MMFSRKWYENSTRPDLGALRRDMVRASAPCVFSSFWYSTSLHSTTSKVPSAANACSSPHAQASTRTSQCPPPSALLSVPSTPSAHAPSPAPCEVTLAARLRRSRGSSVGKSVSVTLDAPKRAATRPSNPVPAPISTTRFPWIHSIPRSHSQSAVAVAAPHTHRAVASCPAVAMFSKVEGSTFWKTRTAPTPRRAWCEKLTTSTLRFIYLVG
mmetsp:Transcript_34237/g.54864  ORF Transcript_34237/g.54864 Transcript_34237/m.54864 type:complete len:212 (+) Transcript_34237:3304-3939(+)